MKNKELLIPKEVSRAIKALIDSGHEASIVGGCVRDLLRGEKPKDWDVTTSAKPENIMKIFPDSFYENKFLTVTVKTGSESDDSLKEIEVTTYRAEGKYTDKRHPDEVRFAKTLEEDLSRRDFTVNAMAIKCDPNNPNVLGNATPTIRIHPNDPNAKNDRHHSGSVNSGENSDSLGRVYDIIDPFGGQEDLKKKLIRAVGDPKVRFEEDALRMMRAVRLAVQLGFVLEKDTSEAIKKLSGTLEYIAKERVRDEIMKIIATPRAKEGIELLHELGLLKHILPELEEGIGVENRPRIFTVWEHNLKALEYGAKAGFSPLVCLTALLHDVGKPRTKGPMKNGEWTFYGHDVVGAQMAAGALERLHFPRRDIDKIATLIRWHLFKYDPNEGITDSSIRRLIRHVGAENMNDLVKLRICDRMGMGVPKALPYRLRHFQFRVEKILREEEAPTPKMLKINGEDIMRVLGISPGPKVGRIIEVLMQEVIDNPARNTSEYLQSRVENLGKLSNEELVALAEEAESKVEMTEDERISRIKSKYYVK